MEGADLLIGARTMIKWGVLPKIFPDMDKMKFLSSDKDLKLLQHHINRISAAESANTTNENNADSDEVTVNLSEKESIQKRRKK